MTRTSMTAGVLTAAMTLVTAGAFAQEAPVLRGVLPVVGSTAGGFGSNFKTSLQMHNKSDDAASGVMVFRQQGAAGSATDASLELAFEAHETVEESQSVGFSVRSVTHEPVVKTAWRFQLA